MASSTYHTIKVQGGKVCKEGQANVAITPGELLEISSGKLIPHTTAGGVLQGKYVALESPTAVAGTDEAIDTDYVADDTVYYAVGQPGDVFYMWLASGETTTVGETLLVSADNGQLAAVTPDATTVTNTIVGVAKETKTNTGAAQRCLVEII